MANESDKFDPESTAKMLAVVYRLSQLLNIPIEDAATIFLKIGTQLMKKDRPS